jgi:membrane protein DedA with SNARE-associated domain
LAEAQAVESPLRHHLKTNREFGFAPGSLFSYFHPLGPIWVPQEKFQRVETFFLRHGEISTFIGRLLPVIRHLISIPAGLSGMNHARFSAYTLLGAFLWCSILTWIGYAIGRNEELIVAHSRQAVTWVVAGSCLLVLAYVWYQRRKAGANPASVNTDS